MANWVDAYYTLSFVEIKEPISIVNLRALNIVTLPSIKSTSFLDVSAKMAFDRIVRVLEQDDG